MNSVCLPVWDYLREHVLFECAPYDSQSQNFFWLRQTLTLDAFEAFRHGSILDEAIFCLGQNKVLLVNDECSSWYSIVVHSLMSIWDRRKEVLYGIGSVGEVRQSTTLQSTRSMAPSAMRVENEWFILWAYLCSQLLSMVAVVQHFAVKTSTESWFPYAISHNFTRLDDL